MKTFSKGIHPFYNKELTSGLNIEKIPLSPKLVIPVLQHLGSPSEVIVKKGDDVIIGQLIAKSSGFVSANIHSPVFGKIAKINPKPIVGGRMASHIEIDVDIEKTKNYVWEKQNVDLSKMTSEEILTKIKEAGIVGLGGATFPTHIKYTQPKDKIIDTLVINGAECEPYLTCDHRLMIEKADEILKATEIVSKLLPLKSIIIGIEANKQDAISAFTKILKNYDLPIEVIPLKVKYPQGAEKMLIHATTKRVVPSGKLPLDVGVVVSNVGTLFAIYEAIYFNKPLIERVVTISGDIVKKGGNFLVPIGTPIEHILSQVEVDINKAYKVIFGGPMMGVAVPSLDYSITKGTSGILFFSEKLAKTSEETPCIKCGNCMKACPMNLMPNRLAAFSKAKKWDVIKDNNLYDCMECGSCAFVCPAKIDIVGWIRYAKNYIKSKNL
ncbi:MAG: electron transport complex subunit RsxC [Spirochaetales bacterium]|nr:electron transport complex subunit RsxC [Spirochaetales bacterium]